MCLSQRGVERFLRPFWGRALQNDFSHEFRVCCSRRSYSWLNPPAPVGHKCAGTYIPHALFARGTL